MVLFAIGFVLCFAFASATFVFGLQRTSNPEQVWKENYALIRKDPPVECFSTIDKKMTPVSQGGIYLNRAKCRKQLELLRLSDHEGIIRTRDRLLVLLQAEGDADSDENVVNLNNEMKVLYQSLRDQIRAEAARQGVDVDRIDLSSRECSESINWNPGSPGRHPGGRSQKPSVRRVGQALRYSHVAFNCSQPDTSIPRRPPWTAVRWTCPRNGGLEG
jgi:hypothetical protein